MATDDVEMAKTLHEEINREIQALTAENKIIRRRGLEKLIRFMFEVKNPYSSEVLKVIFPNLYKQTLKLFADPTDRTRELAVTLITKFCEKISNVEEYLAYIIPTIHQRLAQDEIQEPTEEIRQLLVESLSRLIDQVKIEIGTYIDEVTQILKKTIVDPFAEVKKVSCTCVTKLSEVAPERFYQQGESLVEPLLKSISHQHYKVRVTVVKTIGVTVLATSGKTVDDVFTHLAQRTFDHSAAVRLAVTDVVGTWLIKLRDRYSFFHKLLPLILPGLSDEMEDIKTKSLEYFIKAGQQYEEENEKGFKEKKEYKTEKHYEYLIKHDRLNLGCRTLVNRNFSKILPALVHDLTDWTPSTRIKCAHLLYYLVLYCEDYITMHMESLSQGLYKAAQDEEREVVEKVIEIAELVGLYVEPNVFCKLILPYIESITTSPPQTVSSALLILAAYIRGTNYKILFDEDLQNVVKVLSLSEISSSLNIDCQDALVQCIRAIVNKTGINHSIISCNIFKILLTLLSITEDPDINLEVNELLEMLSKMLNLPSKHALFTIYGKDILLQLTESSPQWTSQSPEFGAYTSLLTESGEAITNILDDSIDIFVLCCDPSKDPDMKQKMFSKMCSILLKNGENIALVSKFQAYTLRIMKNVILPNCVWQAGRTAAALRAIVIAFLWSLLQCRVIQDDDLKECFNDLHTHMTSCLDEFNSTTRLMAIKVIAKLLQVCGSAIEVEQLHVIYPELLKRMDDNVDENRLATTFAFTQYFKALPASYDKDFYRAHLECIYKVLLIHLDDQKEEVQEAVFVALKEGSQIHPGLLKQLTEDVRLKHRTKTKKTETWLVSPMSRYCEKLIAHCERL